MTQIVYLFYFMTKCIALKGFGFVLKIMFLENCVEEAIFGLIAKQDLSMEW